MKKRVIVAALLVSGVAIILALYFWLRPPDDPGNLVLSGNIEITEVQVGFRIPGHVEGRTVSEGDRVQKGDLVASLDTAELKHEVALRRAELAAARAELAEMKAGYRSEEIAQTRAAFSRAEAELEEAKSDFRRQERLYREEVISEREMEQFKAAFAVAQARAAEAKERLSMHQKGFRQERVSLAEARVEQAEEALEKARTRLGFATLVSPLNGVVISDNIEAGEHVAAGTPVVTIGDMQQPWLRAYVEETDLGRVHLGQKAFVSTDTFPGRRYEGRVAFIASEAEFTPKQVQTDEQRTKLVYRVKIEIDNPRRELRPGMPADAGIILDEEGQ